LRKKILDKLDGLTSHKKVDGHKELERIEAIKQQAMEHLKHWKLTKDKAKVTPYNH
jgi:hypothetical protein